MVVLEQDKDVLFAPISSLKNHILLFALAATGLALVLSGKFLALLRGRVHVAAEDVRDSVFPTLRHRLLLNFEGEADKVDTDDILREIIATIDPPGA